MIDLKVICNMIRFRSYCKSTMKELDSELSVMKPIYEIFLTKETSGEIQQGSRVICFKETEYPVNGRVLAIKNGKYSVNRDGYAGTINLQRSDLENLSIGPVAELERQIWIRERRISKLNLILEDAEMPDVLLHNKHNFIQVIDIIPRNPIPGTVFQLITFISSQDMLSYKLKIQTGLIHADGFYQIEMENEDIKSILRSTKENFERERPLV